MADIWLASLIVCSVLTFLPCLNVAKWILPLWRILAVKTMNNRPWKYAFNPQYFWWNCRYLPEKGGTGDFWSNIGHFWLHYEQRSQKTAGAWSKVADPDYFRANTGRFMAIIERIQDISLVLQNTGHFRITGKLIKLTLFPNILQSEYFFFLCVRPLSGDKDLNESFVRLFVIANLTCPDGPRLCSHRNNPKSSIFA